MLTQSYVSDNLIQLLASEQTSITGMMRLFNDVQQLNKYFSNKDWSACHIHIRNIMEYTKNVYEVSSIPEIINSSLWRKTEDVGYYQKLLVNIDNKVEDFFKKEEDQQKEDIINIENLRLFANNYLHPGVNRHHFIMDEWSLPERYQMHVLISICQLGLVSKHNQKNDNTSTMLSLKWESGLAKIDKEKDENRDIDLIFFLDVFYKKEKQLSEESLSKESVIVAKLLCEAKFKEARKYINGLLSSTKKISNLNRWGQLKLCSAYLYYIDNKNGHAITDLNEIYSSLNTDYPHIAKEAAYLLRGIYGFDDVEQYQKWSAIIDNLEDARDKLIDNNYDYVKVFNEVYEEVIDLNTGRNRFVFGNGGILGSSIRILASNIMNACSYGLLSYIPKYLKQFLQAILIDGDLHKNYEDTQRLLLEVLPIALQYKDFDEKTLKIAAQKYSDHRLTNSLPEIFIEMLTKIDSFVLIDLVKENVYLIEEHQLKKLEKKVFSKLNNTQYLSTTSTIHWKDAYLSLWIDILRHNDELLNEKISTLTDKLANTDYDAIFKKTYKHNKAVKSLSYLFLKLTEKINLNKQIKLELCNILFKFMEVDSEHKEQYCLYYLLLNGNQARVKNMFSPIDLWQIGAFSSRKNKIYIPIDNLLEYFSERIEVISESNHRKLKTVDDMVFNNFGYICYSLSSYSKGKGIDNYKKVAEFILKLISKQPKRIKLFEGFDYESFWGQLYLFLTTNIPKEIKNILFEWLKENLDSLKAVEIKNNLRDISRKYRIVEEYYCKVINALIHKKHLSDEELYEILFDIEYDKAFSYMPSSFYMLSRQLTKKQKVFICNYLLNILTKKQYDLLTQQRIAFSYKGICIENPFFLERFNEKAFLITPKIKRIILEKE